MKSADKQIISSDEKSDTKANKSLTIKESIQEQGRKRIRQAPADFQHKEKQQVDYHQKVSQKQGIFEEVLQAHKVSETSRAATIQRQRQATGTPKEFFRTPLTRPSITQRPLSVGAQKKL